MNVRAITLAAAVSLAALGATPQESPPISVRVWTGEESIPTYPLGPEDPNPHFFELEGTVIYPYSMQDRFGTERVEHRWRAAYLENEYLRVTVLPDIGGRIHSVLDKVTGQEMFYRNGVIRPGHIALRGAWVSGGVEWNRGPQGHTVTSFAPVDVLPQQNPDGSASLLIGNVERNYRTGWQVTLSLRPGVRALDEAIRLYNPTDVAAPYYFWNNTAFPERPGTRFIFPMSLGTDHSATQFFRWPLHEGRDLTWLRNYPEPTSIFGVRVAFDFFGAYDVDRDFGIVQFADHRVLPDKKAWTWGQSDDGAVAQSVLTDEDGAYIEVQSGPLPTQSDFGVLLPGQEIAWQETWYPVDGLGDGFEVATADVAMQRHAREDGSIELRFAATSSAPGARLEVQRGDGRSERHRLDLSPARVAQVSLEGSRLDPGQPLQLRVLLENADGAVLLDARSPLPVPERVPPTSPVPAPGAEAELIAGRALERAGDRPAARARYLAALEHDPQYTAALVALGQLHLQAGEWPAAAERLRRALQRDVDLGLAWYLLGVAELRLEQLEAAEAAGAEASKRAGTVALGHSLRGRARARGGDYRGALDSFNAGLAAGGADWTRLFEMLLLASHGAGQEEAAAELSRRATRAGSLRLVHHLLPALSAQSNLTESTRQALAWVGDDEFAMLEVAIAFADLGLFRDGANLLEAAFVAQVPADRRPALPLYWMAWLSQRAGEGAQAERWLQQAAARPVRGAMPSRVETLEVLQFATSSAPRDAGAWELLGNLYAGLGRLAEAGGAWGRAAALSPATAAARRSLGLLAAREGDDAGAERWLREAAAAEPDDQVVARDLARVQLRRGDAAGAVQTLETASSVGGRRADVIVLQAQGYVLLGRHDDALALLQATAFTNREGDQGARAVYVQAHLARGEQLLGAGDAAGALAHFDAALLYPANLNVGRPDHPREAAVHEARGRALQALGRASDATAAWRACIDGALAGDGQEATVQRCREALADAR